MYRFGTPLPDKIKDAPALMLGSGFYLEAFFELDTERGGEMSVRAIPRSKIVEYANDYGLDFEEREDLLFIIRSVDNEHIKRINSKTKQQNAKKNAA